MTITKTGLRITVVDPNPDYLGVDIEASSNRFAGSAHIYAGLDQLSDFAAHVAGFPESPRDERKYEFGSREPRTAGGYCSLRFYCVDGAGHAAIEFTFEDDDLWFPTGTANFILKVLPADIDRFVEELRNVEQDHTGEAYLPGAV